MEFGSRFVYFGAPENETIATLPEIAELNVGYFMISEALFVGLPATVRSMRFAMERGRRRSLTCIAAARSSGMNLLAW